MIYQITVMNLRYGWND